MSAKGAIKHGVGTAGKLLVRDRASRVVVLCYHSIHPSLPFASVSPEQFRAHLDWLASSCDVVRLVDVPGLSGEGGRRRPAVALTFDDGYRDNFAHALPVLEEAGLTATFFLTVGLIERDPAVVRRFAQLRGTRAEDVAGITWSEAADLVGAGHDVGSHTWSHPMLASLGRDSARVELARSREVLQERLGRSITLLAYPFGKPGAHFTAETQELVSSTGYTLAAAAIHRSVRATDSPLAVPRFFATRDDVDTLAAKVLGAWDWLGIWQERAPQWLLRRVSPADFRDPADLRRA